MSKPPPRIFDRRAWLLHRARALRMNGDAFLAVEAAQGIADRLGAVRRRFATALDVGSLPAAAASLNGLASEWTQVALDEDEVVKAEPESFDLATSVLALHAVNDLPGVLLQIRRALKPDGLFVAALFGGNTLFELRDALAVAELETAQGISPRVAPFADVRDLGALLQRAGFALPVADVERTVVRYSKFETLVRDLRLLGETNALTARHKGSLARDTLAAALSHYRARHADADGRLRATFEIIYLTGWVPHQSQQQPLRPGSAKMRLAEALGTEELAAGDKAGPPDHT